MLFSHSFGLARLRCCLYIGCSLYITDGLKNIPIEGTIDLDAVKSNQYNVIIVKGQLSGVALPEQIALKILYEENLIEILYQTV